MEQPRGRSPLAARIMAGLVFLIGVLLMAGTFYLAFTMFQDPRAGLFASPAKGQPPLDLGTQALVVVARVVLLLVMGYAGSSIASKGIALYEATRRLPEA